MPRAKKSTKKVAVARKDAYIVGVMCIVAAFFVYLVGFTHLFSTEYTRADANATSSPSGVAVATAPVPIVPALDKDAYNAKMLFLSHIKMASTTTDTSTTTPPGKVLIKENSATMSVSAPGKLWPTPAVYPVPGALLPNNRIVAYYGNFYSTGMGVLGQYQPDDMISRLKDAVAEWQAADPATPVIPAIDYIVETAQGSPGKDGKYRLRMPDDQIDKAIALANEVHGIVFLDFQVGLSNVQTELPIYEKYLAMPNVHLALDPEFAMHNGAKPGTVVGTMDAADINYAANYLDSLVKANNLPPKILVVHRFTQNMVTNYQNITPLPDVQVVMDMDGWGFGAKKINTYESVIQSEPVQFTGFKLFYKNDLKPPSTRMLTPTEILDLTPAPSYIQYQ